jgi:hypothetical protein
MNDEQFALAINVSLKIASQAVSPQLLPDCQNWWALTRVFHLAIPHNYQGFNIDSSSTINRISGELFPR